MLLIQITGGLVLVVLVVAFFVRGRLTRDEGTTRENAASTPGSRRDVRPTLPTSPYQPSRGFRILDGDEPRVPVAPVLPRLDVNKEFVFGDTSGLSSEPLTAHLRHDEKWALERSMRHTPRLRIRRRRRLTFALVIVILAFALVAVLALHHFGTNAPQTGLSNISQVGRLSGTF